MDIKCSKLSFNHSASAHFRHSCCEKAETLSVCSCQIHTYRTYQVLCVLGWLRDLSIHHSPWSAVSRGEDGSSKLGPCGRIQLPLSCVWHRRWISVSPTTQTSEDPWSIWAGGCLYLAASQVHALSVIGSLSHSACVGSVFSTIRLGESVCVCVCGGGGAQRKEGISAQQLLMRLSRSKQLKVF